MLTERKREEVWGAFKEYEFVAVFFTYIALTTAYALILPFVAIYTRGVSDINYYDTTIALLMVIIGSVEMLHIPSGHIINMSGNFRVSKNFQILACAVLIVSMSVLGTVFGVYGMLGSLLLVAILLAVLEIGWVHTKFFEGKTAEYILMGLPFLLCGALSAFAVPSRASFS